MEKFLKAARSFYGIAMIGLGIQQFYFADLLPVIFSPWPHMMGVPVWAYIIGAILIAAGIAIIFEIKARIVSLFLGSMFLVLCCFSHLPYEIIVDPYSNHLGVWTNALKELALAGGAFIIAGSFAAQANNNYSISKIGSIFFSIMLTCFGIDHFLYPDFVAPLVPAWMPGHIFWTYFAAVALIGSGTAIILNIKVRLIASLLGIMLFLWLVMLHIPRAIAAPVANKGNELTSVFEALAFSGIAFLIALKNYKRN